MRIRLSALSLFVMLIGSSARAEEVATAVSPAVKDNHGLLVHIVKSPYQTGPTKIRVLLPDRFEKAKRYRVLYILPVEAKDGNHYGDGLREAKKLDLANRFGVICVAPTFSQLPWYADHPTDKGIRQETYLLKTVIPAVEKNYPAIPKADGRFLVGFSKSGWGAFTLILRHPDVFAKAAAWDAPLMKAKTNQFGMGPIFGTQENFENYQITKLIAKQAATFDKKPRLILAGYSNFAKHHKDVYELLKKHKFSFINIDGPNLKHHWNTGWLDDAVRHLLK